jgi:hypothetical protein
MNPNTYLVSPKIKSEIEKLLQPTIHICPSCNKKIAGDIPYKVHLTKCPAINHSQQSPAPAPKKPVQPATELSRLLRGRKKHKVV